MFVWLFLCLISLLNNLNGSFALNLSSNTFSCPWSLFFMVAVNPCCFCLSACVFLLFGVFTLFCLLLGVVLGFPYLAYVSCHVTFLLLHVIFHSMLLMYLLCVSFCPEFHTSSWICAIYLDHSLHPYFLKFIV